MRRLIVHLGLPKTGTTTLQKHLFPQFKGYLGRRYPTDPDDPGRVLQKLFIGPQSHWEEGLRAWIENIPDQPPTLVLSDEHLSKWPDDKGHSAWPFSSQGTYARKGARPIAHFLGLLQSLSQGMLKVEAVIVLRNQADFMASLYAQMHRRPHDLGLEAFEPQVRRLLRQPDPFFDWSQFVEELCRQIGQEAVHVLFFEEGLTTMWSYFVQLLGEDFDYHVPEEIPRENALRMGGVSWTVNSAMPLVSRRGRIGRLRSRLRELLPAQSGRLLTAARAVGEWVDRVVQLLSDIRTKSAMRAGPSEQIGAGILSLSPQTRLDILSAFNESNKNLERLIGREIGELGYLVSNSGR